MQSNFLTRLKLATPENMSVSNPNIYGSLYIFLKHNNSKRVQTKLPQEKYTRKLLKKILNFIFWKIKRL